MALAAQASRQAKAVGAFTEFACGVDAAAGTSSVVTVPSFFRVLGVVCGGNTSTTAPFVDTVSNNTFTITKASGDVISWIAFGIPRV